MEFLQCCIRNTHLFPLVDICMSLNQYMDHIGVTTERHYHQWSPPILYSQWHQTAYIYYIVYAIGVTHEACSAAIMSAHMYVCIMSV